MIIKNVCGEGRYFSLGRRGVTLANNATTTVADDNTEAIAKVQHYVRLGTMEIIEAPATVTPGVTANVVCHGHILASGAVSDADYVTVAGRKFVFGNDPGTGVLGTYYSGLTGYWAGDGAAAGTAMGTLKTAINANTAALGVIADTAVTIGSGAILPLRTTGTINTGKTLVKSGTNLAVSGATMTAGTPGNSKQTVLVRRVSTTADVSAGAIVLGFGFVPRAWLISVRTAAGAVKAWDGACTLSVKSLVLTNAGDVDWADTDVITILVQE